MANEHPCGQGPCRDWDDHDFKEVYYGHECKKCGLFYAFGCAPWDDEEQLEREVSNGE